MEGIIIGILCFYKKDEKKRKEVNVNYAITAQENIEREHFFLKEHKRNERMVQRKGRNHYI